MAVLPLLTLPDSRLSLCSEEVRAADFGQQLEALANNMLETMYHNKGIGLAAVQVGVHKRICVIDLEYGSDRYEVPEDDGVGEYRATCSSTVIVNPVVIEESEQLVTMEEGCLSVPGHREIVRRPERIVVQYTDLNKQTKYMKACGLLARCLQHELDHLNGVVFLQRISKLKRDMIMEKIRRASKH